ncbi:MAG TPA: dTDP-glucose 4,6-dehydratase [Candidatus Saccharimonadales bacterium]|nr:dTDP-glucose 4,6-dehydratase [Candidatus Saccharimonadales bacterium]
MRLAVTGGAGFIGSAFIRHWIKNHPQDQVINIDKLTYAGNLENLKEIDSSPNYKFIKADIADQKAMKQALKEIDVLVNFAAESHVDRSIIDANPFIETNVKGTAVLLEEAKEKRVRKIIHFSTDEVFGSLELNETKKFDENTPHKPKSPYAASKAAAEDIARAYAATYELPLIVMNVSNNYGPFHFPEKLIPLAITNAMEDQEIPVYGDGFYVREWTYVDDTALATEAVIEKGKAGETYLFGTEEELPNIEVLRMILKKLGKPESLLKTVKDRPGHDRRYALDSTKARKELGWSHKYDFEKGLVQTIDWYKNNLDWWKRVKSGEYQSYYKKQYVER